MLISVFLVQNYILNLICVPMLWIQLGYFVVKKAGVKCIYQSFLVYKKIIKY